ncbi:OmpA family protein [Sneathiella limimaris]|uniref:OmpA family protein n=1 Tax=Sneathiella limimaris TaxID=1964213 RepID=UPI00146C13AA|nr:OmpA family protein [Sneathiella limimaris]
MQDFYGKLNERLSVILGTVRDQKSQLQDFQSRLSDVEKAVKAGNKKPLSEPQLKVTQRCADKKPVFQIPFEVGSASLHQAKDLQSLKYLAMIYKKRKDKNLYLEGYADPTGPNALNEKLSFQRAQTVSRILQQHGLSATRLILSGRGSNQPENTSYPRRVDIRICP